MYISAILLATFAALVALVSLALIIHLVIISCKQPTFESVASVPFLRKTHPSYSTMEYTVIPSTMEPPTIVPSYSPLYNAQGSKRFDGITVNKEPSFAPTVFVDSPSSQTTIVAPLPLNAHRPSIHHISPQPSTFRPISPALVNTVPIPVSSDSAPTTTPTWVNCYPSGTTFIPSASSQASLPPQYSPIPVQIDNPDIPHPTTPPSKGDLVPHPTLPPGPIVVPSCSPSLPHLIVQSGAPTALANIALPTTLPNSVSPLNIPLPTTPPPNSIPLPTTPTSTPPLTPTVLPTTPPRNPRPTTPPCSAADITPRPTTPPTSPGSYVSAILSSSPTSVPPTTSPPQSTAVSLPTTPTPIAASPALDTSSPSLVTASPTYAQAHAAVPVRSTFQRFPSFPDMTPQLSRDTQPSVPIASLQGEVGVCEACNVEPCHETPKCGHKICSECNARPTCPACDAEARAPSPDLAKLTIPISASTTSISSSTTTLTTSTTPTPTSPAITATTTTTTTVTTTTAPTAASTDSLASSAGSAMSVGSASSVSSGISQSSIRHDAVAGPSSQVRPKTRTPSPILAATAHQRGKLLTEKWKICYLCGKNPKNMVANCGHCMCRECMMASSECKFCHSPITKGQTIVM
eukprot:Phypoly_transcript_03712.p1 GENE.Phypoly_transcript_03712~~Phypoly_transcript_03712.p1  ORF type:complete len:632 (+),score=120.12 Phypoly_transcript_03712:126-2021(+)